jgi:hypothetical protein
MKAYGWAASALKLARAKAVVKSGNEDEVKAEYIRIGGLVNDYEVIAPVVEEKVEKKEEVKESKVTKAVKAVKKEVAKKK